MSIGPYTGPLCHVLQYLSSAVGLAVMAARPGAARSLVGPALVLVAAAATLIGGVQATAFFTHNPNIYRMLEILLTRSLAWFAALYLVAGTVVTLEHAHERVSGSAT